MNKTPICPNNNILVKIDKKFQDEIMLDGGIKLFQDTTFRPEWHVTITGKVVSVPRHVDGHDWPTRGKMLQQVEVGDEIAFSYLVVFDLQNSDDKEEVYYEDPIGNPFLTQFSNKLGRKILVRYRVQDDLFDVGLYDDNNIVYEIKEKLTYDQKESYLATFSFAETNKVSYNNLLELAGEDYWSVDYGHVIAIKREGYFIPASGRAILSLPKMTMEDHEDVGIVLINPTQSKARGQNESKVIALGEPLVGEKHLDITPGDRVIFDHRFAEHYNMWGVDLLVLPHKKLLAIV